MVLVPMKLVPIKYGVKKVSLTLVPSATTETPASSMPMEQNPLES